MCACVCVCVVKFSPHTDTHRIHTALGVQTDKCAARRRLSLPVASFTTAASQFRNCLVRLRCHKQAKSNRETEKKEHKKA